MTKRFNSVVVIHRMKLRIQERRTLRGREETELARQELADKYEGDEFDIIVTYGGPFDLLEWMTLRELQKTEVN